MKRTTALILLLLLVLLPLGGCFITEDIIPDTLTLTAPDSVYPPCWIELVASGVTGGQYTFSVDGNTTTGSSASYTVMVRDLPSLTEPLIATVTWTDGLDTQVATASIALENIGPVIGLPQLNGVYAYTFSALSQARRVLVTFPNAYDPEGGPVKMVDASVYVEEWGRFLSIFCPPFEGVNPPKPDAYHVGLIKNAFAFYTYWSADLQETTQLPLYPFGHSESTYQSTCQNGKQHWPSTEIARGDVIITATFEDEQGQHTMESWTIPISPYSPCGSVQSPSSVL